MNPVETVAAEIRAVVEARGKWFFRYQANNCTWQGRSVTYVIHSKPTRPRISSRCDGDRIVFNRLEGKTERCNAYRGLSQFLDKLIQEEN